MKNKIISTFLVLVGLLVFSSSINKQANDIPDIDAYAKRVFEIMISNDSLAYDKEINLHGAELELIVKTLLKTRPEKSRALDSIRIQPEIEKEFKSMKAKFFEFPNRLREEGIVLKDCKYINSYFTISTEREIGNQFPMAIFEIQFAYKSERYAIKFRESISVNGKWWVANVGNSLVNLNKNEDLVESLSLSDTTAVEVVSEYAEVDSAVAVDGSVEYVVDSAVVYEEPVVEKKAVVKKKAPTKKSKPTSTNKK